MRELINIPQTISDVFMGIWYFVIDWYDSLHGVLGAMIHVILWLWIFYLALDLVYAIVYTCRKFIRLALGEDPNDKER